MAWTQTDIDNLKAAIATGTTEVEYDGQRVRYRSLSEMREALRMMEQEVTPASSVSRVSYVSFGRD